MATLSFKTKFPWGDQTYFIPKIWRGLIDNLGMYDDYMSYVATILNSGNEKMMEAFFPVENLDTFAPKIHTIREDPHDLWKPGRKIHMAVFNRTKNRFQFAPVLECKGVQKIRIAYVNKIGVYNVRTNTDLRVVIEVKDKFSVYDVPSFEKVRGDIEMNILARNDGFNSVDDFFRFFKMDFKGKIINWTEYKY